MHIHTNKLRLHSRTDYVTIKNKFGVNVSDKCSPRRTDICKNGGLCSVDDQGIVHCDCSKEYHGIHCETSKLINTCEPK